MESRTCVDAINRYLEDSENADVADWSKYTSRLKGIGLIDQLTAADQFEWFSSVFFDTTETMKTKNADLNKLQEETFVAIVTGAEPIEKFDTFVEDWNKRGGEQITKEVQEIVDNQ